MSKYEKHTMTWAEYKYSFDQSTQIASQTGLIGYLLADLGVQGNYFHSSRRSVRKDLVTPAFTLEFEDLIDSLQEEGDILSNQDVLAQYCRSNPQSKMEAEQDYYGVRIDTEKYAYLLRLSPKRDEHNPHNLYCYCYVKKWLDAHIRRASNGIRFINSEYEELFRIPDGGKIKICFPDEESLVKTCRYIDDYHVEVGTNLYHICEFAERMEQAKATYEPVEPNKR